jgi:hypothetical protein
VAQRNCRLPLGSAARVDVPRVRGGRHGSGCEVVPRLARPTLWWRLRIQAQVGEDLLDDRSLKNGRDDLELAAATVGAVLHVDVEHAFENQAKVNN